MTVHVFSDGTPEETRVVGPDGVEIPNIISMRIDGEIKEPIKISLEIMMPRLDVDATVQEVVMRCPLCGHDNSHKCGTMS